MHYVGVVLCMLGGSITILTDKGSTSSDVAHPHSYRGDILAVLAALGYGVGDACSEFWSKHVNREEYLGMIGLFGAIWTLTASFVFERDAVLEVFAAKKETMLPTLGAMLWYIVSLVAYYFFASSFMMKSDATLLNLSLQTSNFWAILLSVVVFRETPDIRFYFAIVLVVSGVFVYELCGNNTNNTSTPIRQEAANDRDDIITESSPLLNTHRRTSSKTIHEP